MIQSLCNKFVMGYFVLSWVLCGIRLDRASSANSSSTELTFSFSCFGAVSVTFSCYCSGCLLSVSRISSEHNLAGTAVIPYLSSRLTEPDMRWCWVQTKKRFHFREYSLGLDLLHPVLGLHLVAHLQQLLVHHLGPLALCQGHSVHPLHAQQV